MTLPRRVSTPRLLLRPWAAADADALFAIKSDPEVTRWLGDPEPFTVREQALTWIEEASDPTAPGRTWCVEHQGRAVGNVGAWPLRPRRAGAPDTVGGHDATGEQWQLGWFLHPDHTGLGIATEAASAVLERAVGTVAEQVWAIMWAHNEPSARVARAIGMDELGVHVDPWYGTDEEPHSLFFRATA